MKKLKVFVAMLLLVGLFAGVGVASGHSAKFLIDPPGFGQS